jgi:hypothetical protein
VTSSATGEGEEDEATDSSHAALAFTNLKDALAASQASTKAVADAATSAAERSASTETVQGDGSGNSAEVNEEAANPDIAGETP